MREFTGFTKGVNLGGWLSQCGPNYNEDHYQTFITKSDLEKIAGWGLDHVRLPIDYNVIQQEDGTFIESGFAHVDNCVRWCEELGLHVILDIHKAKGFVFDNENDCEFFTKVELQDNFITLWKEIARRYHSYSFVAFELLNEVTAMWMAEPWNAIIARTVPEIRKIAPSTKIIVGGIFNNSVLGVTLLDAPHDENMVFTFHCYSPFVFTHQGASWLVKMPNEFRTTFPKTAPVTREESLSTFGEDFDSEFIGLPDEDLGPAYFERLFAPAIAVCEKHNIPLYCGEYGVIKYADPDSTLRWYQTIHQALTNCGIARSAWTYKSMVFGITDEHCAPIYEDLITQL